MAEEKFPEVRPGQPISAARANQEGRVLERLASMAPGSGMVGWHGGTSVQFSRTQDARLSALRVVLNKEPNPEVRHTGTLREYDFNDKEWKDGQKKWVLDTKVTGGNWPNDGDLVAAYYDQKRGSFVPVAPDELYYCILTEPYTGPYTCFEIRIGVWCKELYRFVFFGYDDESLRGTGIDLSPRTNGNGEPLSLPAYTKGWFKRMPSRWEPSGFVYVAVTLDGMPDPINDFITECPDVAEDPCEEPSSQSSSPSLPSSSMASSSSVQSSSSQGSSTSGSSESLSTSGTSSQSVSFSSLSGSSYQSSASSQSVSFSSLSGSSYQSSCSSLSESSASESSASESSGSRSSSSLSTSSQSESFSSLSVSSQIESSSSQGSSTSRSSESLSSSGISSQSVSFSSLSASSQSGSSYQSSTSSLSESSGSLSASSWSSISQSSLSTSSQSESSSSLSMSSWSSVSQSSLSTSSQSASSSLHSSYSLSGSSSLHSSYSLSGSSYQSSASSQSVSFSSLSESSLVQIPCDTCTCTWQWNGSYWEILIPCIDSYYSVCEGCDCEPPSQPGGSQYSIQDMPCFEV